MNQINSLSILATAPCRADLAGGTLDLWPIYLFHQPAVTVNFALTIRTSCRITPNAKQQGGAIHLKSLDTGREDRFANFSALANAARHQHSIAALMVKFFEPQGGFTIETHSESPAGAGISGSSALMIATTAALAKYTEEQRGRKLTKEQLRVIAQNVETQIIHVPTGSQDYYPALYGGASALHLAVNGIRREALAVPAAEINSRFLIAYTGAPRQSGINNWEVFQASINGDKRVTRNFDRIAAIATAMRAALLAQNWNEVARLMREEWKLRRTNAPGITTPLIDHLVATALKYGGRAAKVCGAGGGGCVVFLVEPDARQRVAEAITAAGAVVLPAQLDLKGLTVSQR